MLRNYHREKSLLDDEIPDILRHVVKFMADNPVVEHLAKLLAGAIQKSLLFVRQFRRRVRHEAIPIRHARKKFAVPPDVACFERFALGVRHRRQHLAIHVEQGFRELLTTNLDEIRQHHHAESYQQQQLPDNGTIAQEQVREDCCARRNRGRAQVNALVRQEYSAANKQQQPQQTNSQSAQILHLLWSDTRARPRRLLLYSSSSIAARSSRNSVSVAAMRARLKSSMSSPCTISYLPLVQRTGYE